MTLVNFVVERTRTGARVTITIAGVVTVQDLSGPQADALLKARGL